MAGPVPAPTGKQLHVEVRRGRAARGRRRIPTNGRARSGGTLPPSGASSLASRASRATLPSLLLHPSAAGTSGASVLRRATREGGAASGRSQEGWWEGVL